MKEIQKVVQKLSREQESAAAAAAAAAAPAYEQVQKHKVTPGIPGWLKYQYLQCRLCVEEDETQEHVLTKCKKTKQTKHQVPTDDIFTKDPEKLKKTPAKIEVILQTINNPPSQHKKTPQGAPTKNKQPPPNPLNNQTSHTQPNHHQKQTNNLNPTKTIPQPPKHQQE